MSEPGERAAGTFARRVRKPLVALLVAGASPRRLALSLALGLAIGAFPVIGATTLLCAVVAVVFRLNLVAIQIVNYLAYPVQLALLIPLVRIGEWMFGAPPIPLSLAMLRASLAADAWGTVQHLWRSEVHAIAAWFLVAPLIVGAAYAIFLPLVRGLAGRIRPPVLPIQ
jgi:uncharacterized protein (DUF2062 family)